MDDNITKELIDKIVGAMIINDQHVIYPDREIVQCKDCANFVFDASSKKVGRCRIGIGKWHSKEWFCANAQRKDEHQAVYEKS